MTAAVGLSVISLLAFPPVYATLRSQPNIGFLIRQHSKGGRLPGKRPYATPMECFFVLDLVEEKMTRTEIVRARCTAGERKASLLLAKRDERHPSEMLRELIRRAALAGGLWTVAKQQRGKR